MTDAPTRDQALFRTDGELLVPTPITRGPWYGRTMHGGAMLAAVARAADRHPASTPRQVVRLTVDLVRAAPMVPVRLVSRAATDGKRVDHVDVEMWADDQLCARGTALRVRTADLDVAPELEPPHPRPPAADLEVPHRLAMGSEPGFHHAVDTHADVDAGIAWCRLAVAVVEGERPSSIEVVAALADLTYAASYIIRTAAGAPPPQLGRGFSLINADTTILVHRPLAGRWLGLRTTTHLGPVGAGTSSAQLLDELGAVGVTGQSLVVRGADGT